RKVLTVLPNARDNVDPDTLHHWAQQLREDYLPDGWRRVASSPYNRVAHHRELGLYCKEFVPRSPAERLRGLLRGSRATRARRNGAQLMYYGFRASRPLHWGRLPGGTEYIFMHAAPGMDINEWLRELDGSDAQTLRRKHELLRALGRHIGRLHATGFIHGDLRPGNIIAEEADNSFRFTLLDNELTTRHSPPPGRSILRNIMQIDLVPAEALSATDRMRFFSAWRSQMRHFTPVEAKVVAREAHRWALRRMALKGAVGR
ncbi:MAG: lipopolysaccharide kinase InaA family protein, partial [Halioglobus sp.]|nr:lipopolysaccharide kinase InaA family protein [Halioglobus sp.]